MKTPMILIAEDNKDIRDCIASFLALEGYAVIPAVDGMEAWEHLEEGRKPDLIITDIMMPNMNGFELISKVRNRKDLRNIKVICFTASKMIKERVDEYKCILVPKPFDLNELLDAIERCTKEKQDETTPRNC